MEELLKGTIEYQNWGWNAMTVSFVGTVFFTLLQMWSSFGQGRTIFQKRSGESVSSVFFIYGGWYCSAFLIYGLTRNSIAMSLNGLLCVPYAFAVYGLYRFKGFTRTDWLLFVLCSAMGPLMYLLTDITREIVLTVIVIGMLLPLGMQMREMYRTKRPGAVDPRFVVVLALSCIFWFCYGALTSTMVLIIFNPLAAAVLSATLFLYYRYKSKAALS